MAERAEHTPGPWKLEAGRHITTESGSFSIHANEDWNRNWVELDENARLIATAPDLLAALKAVVAYYDGNEVSANTIRESWLPQARATIEAASSSPHNTP